MEQVPERHGHPMDEAILPDGETFLIASPYDKTDDEHEVAEDQAAFGGTGLPR